MRAWLEIDLDKLRRNVEVIRTQIGRTTEIIAVVKSDAYGHGLPKIVEVLDQLDVGMFAVISLEEAWQVRQISDKPVLIFGYLDSRDLVEAIEAGFVLSLYDKELVPFYERVAARLGKVAHVHVKVDTGLNRLGMPVKEAIDFLMSQRLFPHLRVEGIFSHFASSTDRAENLRQLNQLQELLVSIQGRAELVPIHLVSSYALTFKEGYFDAVRIGLALYGVDAVLPGLEPILSCKSVVMQVKNVAKGEGVGYGHLFTAPNDLPLAVIAMGYGEGLSQALTGQLTLLVNGIEVPVIGQISMNTIAADVSTAGPVKRGDEVVIIGSQKGHDQKAATINVAALAKRSGIRHHEIVTRLGQALPKFYSPK